MPTSLGTITICRITPQQMWYRLSCRVADRPAQYLLWHPKFHQLVGNTALCAIVVNPDFAIFDIHMDETTIFAMLLVPTCVYKLVMVTFRIKNQLQLYLAIGGLVMAMPLNHLSNILAILI